MTFFRSLILVSISAALAVTVIAEETNSPEMVGHIASEQTQQNDYLKAIQDLVRAMDLNGAQKAGVLLKQHYNKTVPGFQKITDDFNAVNIPRKYARLTTESALCDVPQNGGCLVVEKDINGNPYAYYLGVAYTDITKPVVWFRKEADNNKYAAQIKLISETQGVDSQIYSQVRNTSDLKRDFSHVADDGNDDQQDDDIVIPVPPVDPSDQDLVEKAEIKNAILNGCPKMRDENGKIMKFQKVNKKTGRNVGHEYSKRLCPKESSILKHTPGMTEVTAAEAAQLEKQATEVYRIGNRNFKKVRAHSITSGMTYCVPVAKIEVKRPRVSIVANFLWSPARKKPDIQGKGKLLCYKGGMMTHRINLEMKYFYGPLGVALALPVGTHYAAGLLSLGVAESPISLLTRKLEDGRTEIFREWVFLVSADVNFGVGIGVDGVGFSSGKKQRPILNIISGSVREGTVGGGVSLFSVGRIGLDPDDF